MKQYIMCHNETLAKNVDIAERIFIFDTISKCISFYSRNQSRRIFDTYKIAVIEDNKFVEFLQISKYINLL